VAVKPKLLTGLAWLWLMGVVVLGALLAVPTQSSQPAAASGCASTGSPAGPFDLLAYEAADWRNTYGRTLELAAFNRLFPESSSFALPRIETGPRSAGSSSTLDPYAPPVLLKAIAWIESGWTMADGSVDYGEIGPPLVSHSGAYGIMQVLSGMENTGNAPTLDQVSIGSHYGFNIGRGARILAEKWNYAPTSRPIVGTRTPSLIEDWYYAIWSYHGFSFTNHPWLNPSYSPLRGVYRCDGTQPYNSFPYQELVLGCVANPPRVAGTALWNSQLVTLPNLAQPAFSDPSNWNDCSGGSNCAGMDIPTPNASHTDPTSTGVTRSQVIGSPSLSVSTGQITLVTIPPVINTPASLRISNAGTGPLAWRASMSASWLKVSRAQGVALGTDLGSQPSAVTVRADPAGLAPGKYTATLTIESLWASRAPATVSVTLYNYPDGTLLRGSGPQVFVMRGGLKRHIPSAATLEAYGFDWSAILTIPDSVLNSLPAGRPLLDVLAGGNMLRGSGGMVYVMDGGVKRHVSSPSAMANCGYGWDAVYAVSDLRLEAIATGSPVNGPPCPRLSLADGLLVKEKSDPVYVIRGGLRRHLPNGASLEAYGYRWGEVDVLPATVLASIPEGHQMLDVLADGNLLRSTGPEVYVMQGGAKRHVVSASVMDSCGYGWDAVYVIPGSRLSSIPTGTSLSGAPCPRLSPPDGTLLRGTDDPVYVMRSGLKRHVPSPSTFEAQGFLWSNISGLPDSVLNSLPAGRPLLDVLADGNLLRGSSGMVYVMDGGVKRHVSSPSAMANCGYGWDAVYAVSDLRLEAIATGSAVNGPPCPRLSLADGLLVKEKSDPVYVIRGGLRRHLPNGASLEAYGYRWGEVDVLPATVLASIPEGHQMLDVLADGNLLRSTGPEVYVMQGGAKRHVVSASVMDSCGYGWDAVYVIPGSRLSRIPTGTSLSGAPCPRLSPPDGTLLRGTDDPVYVTENEAKRHIAGREVFEACQYRWGNVNVILDTSLAGIPDGPTVAGPPCP
jgi:hypothetical protein